MDTSGSYGGHRKDLNKYIKRNERKKKHTHGARDTCGSCGSHGKHLNKYIKGKKKKNYTSWKTFK